MIKEVAFVAIAVSDAERARNPDVRAETFGDPFGDARFAVARRAEQKHAAAGVDRRAEFFQHRFIDEEVGERFLRHLVGIG